MTPAARAKRGSGGGKACDSGPGPEAPNASHDGSVAPAFGTLPHGSSDRTEQAFWWPDLVTCTRLPTERQSGSGRRNGREREAEEQMAWVIRQSGFSINLREVPPAYSAPKCSIGRISWRNGRIR